MNCLTYPVNLRHYLKWRMGMQPAYSQTSVEERRCLLRYAEGKRKVAEIGVFEGVNSRQFRSRLPVDGVLILVDPYPRRLGGTLGFGWIRRIAHAEVAREPNGRVMWVETTGAQAPSEPSVSRELPVDMLFIDGDHSYEGVRGDWEAWRLHVRRGGIIALHDSVNCKMAGVGSERFTQEVVKSDPEFRFVEEVDTLTIMQRV